ncbi:MAG: SDR family oxidoreductase [Burkholderiaceae bacterium]|nr:MAG: SDR family oxidoreductase [Burkholderiaceae bacterium]MBE7426876.1 SDR family oxidoreductase [Ideonella sp.]MCC7286189.1 SDR family oxidoreductase [Burkholderiaceae bacterium]
MNRIDLHERVAVITGGAQGFGYATAARMLDSGAAVALWDIDSARLEQARVELSARGSVTTAVVELTSEAGVADAVQATLERHGQIDILVNNAGITGGNGPTWELEPAVWRRVIEVNLVAPYLVCRAVVPHMIARRYGRIVNIASIAGKEGNPNASHYSASKAGLISLTKSLGKELAQAGVAVNCVTPAAARTAIFDTMTQAHIDFMLAKIPMGRFLLVEELAAMVCWLSSQDCSFSTGGVFDISGGRATY